MTPLNYALHTGVNWAYNTLRSKPEIFAALTTLGVGALLYSVISLAGRISRAIPDYLAARKASAVFDVVKQKLSEGLSRHPADNAIINVFFGNLAAISSAAEKNQFLSDYKIVISPDLTLEDAATFAANGLLDQLRPSHRYITLPDDQKATLWRTVGEGSCGVHAIFGELCDKGADIFKFKCDSAQQIRADFADYIYSLWFSNKLPKRIIDTLDEIYSRFDQPNILEEKLKSEMRPIYESIQLLKLDNPQLAFRNNPTVIKAYLKHIKNIKSPLSDYEMFELVAFKNKKLILVFQHGNELAFSNVDLEPASDLAGATFVWYTPGHFEAMTLNKVVEGDTAGSGR